MKTPIRFLLIAAFAGVLVTGCTQDNQNPLEPETDAAALLLNAVTATPALPTLDVDIAFSAADPYTIPLIADGRPPGWPDGAYASTPIPVGEVQVYGNGSDGLYYRYVMTLDDVSPSGPDWCLTGYHFNASLDDPNVRGNDWPLTKKGSPKVGKFAYGESYDPCIEDTGWLGPITVNGAAADDDLFLAAHAGVKEVAPTTISLVSAVGDDAYGPKKEFSLPGASDWGTANPAVKGNGAVASHDWGTADMISYAPDYPWSGSATWPVSAVDAWWWFPKTVTIPNGYEIAAAYVEATADNAERFYVDGVDVPVDVCVIPSAPNTPCNGEFGDTDDGNDEFTRPYAWESVTKYEFAGNLREGDNDLSFLMRDYKNARSGLIYNGEIVLHRTESAWAGYPWTSDEYDSSKDLDGNWYGHDFLGKDWSTYFGYAPTYPVTYTCPATVASDDFVFMNPPHSVARQESENEKLQVFAESITQVNALGVDVDEGALTPEEYVCTYYLLADGLGTGRTVLVGTVAFTEDILALAYTGSTAPTNTECDNTLFRLYDTDAAFGATGTVYPVFAVDAHRGLECGAQDEVTFQNPNTVSVSFDLGVYEATDGIRVFLPVVTVP